MKHTITSSFLEIDKISVISAITALGLLMSRFLDIPGRSIQFIVFGSPFAIWIDGQMIINLLIVGLIYSGTDMVMRNHPVFNGDSYSIRPYYHCIGPASIILLLSILLNEIQNHSLWLIGMLLSIIVLTFVIFMEYGSIMDSQMQSTHVWLISVYYIVLFGWFLFIQNLQFRSIVSSSVALIISSALCTRILVCLGLSSTRSLKNGFAIGILAAEIVWVTSYLFVSPIVTASLLLLMIHIAIGLISNYSVKEKFRNVLIEYGIVLIVVLTIILVVEIL